MPNVQTQEAHTANDIALYDMLKSEALPLSESDKKAYRDLISDQNATDPTRFEMKDDNTGEESASSAASIGDIAIHESGVNVVHSESWQTEEK